jgi:hypothetical protein
MNDNGLGERSKLGHTAIHSHSPILARAA